MLSCFKWRWRSPYNPWWNLSLRDLEGGISDKSCFQCPPGQYCGQDGLSKPSGLCTEGYICLHGSKSPTPQNSSTGHLCPMGGFCQPGALTGRWLKESFELASIGQNNLFKLHVICFSWTMWKGKSWIVRGSCGSIRVLTVSTWQILRFRRVGFSHRTMPCGPLLHIECNSSSSWYLFHYYHYSDKFILKPICSFCIYLLRVVSVHYQSYSF